MLFLLYVWPTIYPDIGINEDIKKNYGPTLIFISTFDRLSQYAPVR